MGLVFLYLKFVTFLQDLKKGNMEAWRCCLSRRLWSRHVTTSEVTVVVREKDRDNPGNTKKI